MQDGKLIGTEDEKERIINVDIKDRSSLAKDGYVWIAFLADNTETEFTITVYTPTATYTKTAKKVFNKGYDYHSNITMQKVMPQPYVEVNGVLWATGNFIRYVDPNNSSNVYWGIAPAQWWISNYGENPTSANKWNGKAISYDDLGSQHWYIDNHNGQFAQTANDLDLFQWGVIADALNFNDVCYLQGTSYNMEGKYYKGRGGLINVTATTTKSEATHGDIVKYWTEGSDHNYHYQYPTEADFDALVSASTIVPAFCYTDKGNKVYGAYFSDNPRINSLQEENFGNIETCLHLSLPTKVCLFLSQGVDLLEGQTWNFVMLQTIVLSLGNTTALVVEDIPQRLVLCLVQVMPCVLVSLPRIREHPSALSTLGRRPMIRRSRWMLPTSPHSIIFLLPQADCTKPF